MTTPNTQELVNVSCPQCAKAYNASIQTIINVTTEPDLKSRFLQGQLNISQCPYCNFTGPLQVPSLYYDRDKELALVYMPQAVPLPHAEEQKVIGQLTNKLINALPPEERKGYLFNPKTFLTLESLGKEVLTADGVTPENLAQQNAKFQLLDKILQSENETEFNDVINAHKDEIDKQLFEILTATAIQALQEGQQNQGNNLLAIRQLMAEKVEKGDEILAEIDKDFGLQMLTPESVIEGLLNAKSEEEFTNLIKTSKSMLDYTFFQQLTSHIETAEAEGDKQSAETLKALRSRILDVSNQIEEETRQLMNEANTFLKQLLTAEDPKAILKENLPLLDENFMALLSYQAQQAEKENNQTLFEQLKRLSNVIGEVIRENLPPEMELLNELMETVLPESIKPILQKNKDLITPDFMQLLDELQGEFETNGQKPTAEKIKSIKKQAELVQSGILI